MDQRFPEKREFTRVRLGLTAELCAAGGAVFSGEVRDLSMGGVYVLGEFELAPGTSCEVEITLAGDAEAPKVWATGRVSRVDGDGLAIRFTEVALDALEHLQKLILYNSVDPDQVEGEFASHLGLKRKP